MTDEEIYENAYKLKQYVDALELLTNNIEDARKFLDDIDLARIAIHCISFDNSRIVAHNLFNRDKEAAKGLYNELETYIWEDTNGMG